MDASADNAPDTEAAIEGIDDNFFHVNIQANVPALQTRSLRTTILFELSMVTVFDLSMLYAVVVLPQRRSGPQTSGRAARSQHYFYRTILIELTIFSYPLPPELREKIISDMYEAVKATDFLAENSTNEEVNLVILCTGIDEFFGTTGYYDQNRLLAFLILISKKILGIAMTRLEKYWLQAWLEAYRIPYQFHWRRRFLKAWCEDKSTYLPRLYGRKLKRVFGRVLGKLADDVRYAMDDEGIVVADVAETFLHCFNKDYQTLEDIIYPDPPTIRRAYRVPDSRKPPPIVPNSTTRIV